MHFWTSSISFAGSMDTPDFLTPQMLSKSTIPAVNADICLYESDDAPKARTKKPYLEMWERPLRIPPPYFVDDMAT